LLELAIVIAVSVGGDHFGAELFGAGFEGGEVGCQRSPFIASMEKPIFRPAFDWAVAERTENAVREKMTIVVSLAMNLSNVRTLRD